MMQVPKSVLEIPNYTRAEAARYFHIAPSTLAYWTGQPNPLVKLSSNGMLSFKNMAELYVLEGLRSIYKVRTDRIRFGVEYLLAHEESPHPLADYEIETDGRDVKFFQGSRLLNASMQGQYEFASITQEYLHRVDRNPEGVAQRIFPFLQPVQAQQTRTRGLQDRATRGLVEINPEICFGLPVLAGSRITTGFLVSRFCGGDSISAIARGYGRPETEIKEAIEWELGRAVNLKAA